MNPEYREAYDSAEHQEMCEWAERVRQDIKAKTGFDCNFENSENVLNFAFTEGAERKIASISMRGQYNGQNAVIKIKGVQSDVSEAQILDLFKKLRNNDKLKTTVRPPERYDFVDWNDEIGYEAVIMEDVGEDRVVKIPAVLKVEQREEGERNNLPDTVQMLRFFNIYNDYHEICVSQPWIENPREDASTYVNRSLTETQEKAATYRSHPHSQAYDLGLLQRAKDVLTREYQGVGLTFQHAPFDPEHLIDINEHGDMALLSNSSWSWKPPYYDLAEGYFRYLQRLSQVEGMNKDFIEPQVTPWVDWMQSVTKDKDLHLHKIDPEQKRLWKLAMIERAAAWLANGALRRPTVNPDVTKYLIERTRENLRSLLSQFPNPEIQQFANPQTL